jgi:hypothetical protein
VRIPAGHYEQLRDLSARNETVPDWLIRATAEGWGLHLRSRPINEVVIVRQPSDYGYGRASRELTLGCNYDCEHCYLDIEDRLALQGGESSITLCMTSSQPVRAASSLSSWPISATFRMPDGSTTSRSMVVRT